MSCGGSHSSNANAAVISDTVKDVNDSVDEHLQTLPISGFILSSTGAVVTDKTMNEALAKAHENESDPTAQADTDRIVNDFKSMLRDLRIHEDSPDAADMIIRMETGEIRLTNGQSGAVRALGQQVIASEKSRGRQQCDTCGEFVSATDPSHPCHPALVLPVSKVREGERVDIHRPSSPDFDPQKYDCLGIYASSTRYLDQSLARGRAQAVADLISRGYKIGHGSSSQCGHCGHHIVYGGLMVREDAKEFIFVGEDCLENRFDLTADEFQTLRKSASLNRHREKLSVVRDAFLAEHPDLVGLDRHDNYILRDMHYYLERNGNLTDKQVDLARKIIKQTEEKKAREEKRAQEEAALLASGVRVPEGKVENITGEVLHVRSERSTFGYHDTWTTKMLVKTGEGWKVWVTVPSKGIGDAEQFKDQDIEQALVGKTVKFNATLKPKNGDPLFAYGKNPSKASVVDE